MAGALIDPVIDFDVQTGFDPSEIQANVRNTLGRPRKAFIYANGPSAKQAPKQWPCVALNGALGLFSDPFRPASYWMACDPQEMVSGFLKTGFASVYMPASKCHESVFTELEAQKAPYIFWHMDDCSTEDLNLSDKVPTAVSITIVAIGKLYQMGFRDLTIYGWDGCYLNGKDHAISQAHNAGNNVTVRLNDQEWLTTPTWAAEAEDAANYIPMFPDLTVRVPGPGMIGAILRHKGVIS